MRQVFVYGCLALEGINLGINENNWDLIDPLIIIILLLQLFCLPRLAAGFISGTRLHLLTLTAV